MHGVVVIAVAVAVLGLVRPAAGIIVSRSITYKDKFYQFERFGFLKGGTMELEATYEPEDAETRFLLCEESEIIAINRQYANVDQLCGDRTRIQCYLNVPLVNGTYTLDDTVAYKGMFYFLLENCGERKIKMKVAYTLMNPGGEHLGYGYIPLPDMYLALSIVGAVYTVVWLTNWVRFYKQRIYLHLLLTIVPLLKIGNLVVNLIFWRTYSSQGTVEDWLVILQFGIAKGLYELAFWMALTCIASSWCITRPTLPAPEVRRFSLYIGFFVLSIVLNSLFDSYYLFLLIVLYVVVMRNIFSSISLNARVLKAQLLMIRRAGIDARTTPVYSKFGLFRSFQSIMVVFVFLDVLSSIINVFFLPQSPWIQNLLREILDILVFLAVGWVFQLRDFAPYFSPIPDDREGDDLTIPSMRDSFMSDDDLQGSHLEPWRPGMPLPPPPTHMIDLPPVAGAETRVLAIQFPGSSSSRARIAVAISVSRPHFVGTCEDEPSGQEIEIGDVVAEFRGAQTYDDDEDNDPTTGLLLRGQGG